jgi:cytochrome c oxidase assembly protein subunit 15
MMAANGRPSRLFVGLAATTAFLTFGLIVFGAVVRVTDSGLGCNNEWPLCHGSLIPPLDNLTAVIEWLHRFFAVVIGLFGLATLGAAITAYRKRNPLVLRATVAAAVLFAVQSTLGALVVVFDLPPTMVTLHLGAAMLLLACLVIAAIVALYRPKIHYRRDNFTVLAYVTTALALVIILTGALVRGSGATLACADYPLCNGQVLPFEQGSLATIHMLHRLAVGGLGLAMLFTVIYAFRQRKDKHIRVLAVAALAVYMMQAGIGAMYVLSRATPEWGAAHVAFAALTWALMILLSTVETVNNREPSAEVELVWQRRSEPALSRSN